MSSSSVVPLSHASAAAEFHRLHGLHQSFGDRLADKVAAWGGSWSFIIGFSIFLGAWTVESWDCFSGETSRGLPGTCRLYAGAVRSTVTPATASGTSRIQTSC